MSGISMNGDTSFTAFNRAEQLQRESTRATQRRYDAGLALRNARRAALANPHDCRNPAIMAAAAANVVAAQEHVDSVAEQAAQSADQVSTMCTNVSDMIRL